MRRQEGQPTLSRAHTHTHTHTHMLTLSVSRKGQMEVLEWLDERDPRPLGALVFACAASAGSVETLDYLREKECKVDPSVAYYAAECGHTHVLDWLKANTNLRIQSSHNLFDGAATGGKVAALEWARKEGVQMTANTSYSAACHGNLEALRWLRRHGCPWNEMNWDIAKMNNHPQVSRRSPSLLPSVSASASLGA